MFDNKKILAVIPARGGSKRIKDKNIIDFHGKPLIAWTVEEAMKSKYIDRLVLSTEDKKIADIAKSFGCEVPFMRPENLALDETPSVEPVLHVLSKISGYDYLLLLQTTSPFRKVEHIDAAIKLTIEQDAKNCVSVTKVTQNPNWMYIVTKEMKLKKFMNNEIITQSQKLPDLVRLNGAIYLNSVADLLKDKTFLSNNSICFEMDEVSSIDIDTEFDLKVAQFFFNN